MSFSLFYVLLKQPNKNSLEVIEKKDKLTHESNPYKRKQKIAKYVMDKGFESSLVWEGINELLGK